MTRKDLSSTMRIDLIPDMPTEPVKGAQKRIVIAKAVDRNPGKVSAEPSSVLGDAHFQALLHSVYDAALITGMDGKVLDANGRANDFFLYGRDDLCKLHVFDLISGADESLVSALCQNLEHERFALIQAYCIRKDGTLFPSEIAVNRLDLGTARLCFFFRDISIRRQAEEMLRTEHRAIQNAGNGIAVADLNAILEFANPAVARMWGYSNPEELLGKDIRSLFDEGPVAAEMVRSVLEVQKDWTGEIRTRTVDGQLMDVQVAAACNRNSDGELVGAVLSFVDIGDRKRAEEAIREAERRRVVLESLGAACHHLGQPATVLLANLGIIQTKLNDSSDRTVRELIGASLDAVDRLAKILHKLNAVNEYRTTQYIGNTGGGDAEENRILQI